MYYFCKHCFSTVDDAVKHFNETSHHYFIHDGNTIDLTTLEKPAVEPAKSEPESEPENV